MSDITKEQVVEWLSGQSVIEIADLVKELEEKMGVSAVLQAVAVTAPARAEAMAETLQLRTKRNSTWSLPNSGATKLP